MLSRWKQLFAFESKRHIVEGAQVPELPSQTTRLSRASHGCRCRVSGTRLTSFQFSLIFQYMGISNASVGHLLSNVLRVKSSCSHQSLPQAKPGSLLVWKHNSSYMGSLIHSLVLPTVVSDCLTPYCHKVPQSQNITAWFYIKAFETHRVLVR